MSMSLFATLYFITIFKSSIAANTLSPTQTLADGEVLTSPSQVFELGFLSPGSTKSRFLGIRYKATPDVVVWVANGQNPITGLAGILTLSKTGNLILTTSSPNQIIWSSNSSASPPSNPSLHLLDTGNLVVTGDGENATYFWQSFDFPGNTRLAGMKMVNDPAAGIDKHLTSWKAGDDPSLGDFVFEIENRGLSQLSVATATAGGRKTKTYRSGPWNGAHFTGLPFSIYQLIESERYFSSHGKLISIADTYSSNSPIMRLTLNSTGWIQRYVMNSEKNGWTVAFPEPYGGCTEYARCGPNGVCRAHGRRRCGCLRGYAPRNRERWSDGCARVPAVDCRKGEGFLEFERYKFPDTLSLGFRLNASMGGGECRRECLYNCSCSAYASPYLSSQRSGCLMWFGDLIDLQEFAEELGAGPSIFIRVPVSELGNKRKKITIVATVASFGVVVLGLTSGVIIFKMRRKRRAYKKKREEFKLPLFDLATIAAATRNFSHENVIGKGGFGPVYKGYLSADEIIAVKRMSTNSRQGDKEFKNEVTLIAKLQHRNLVRILGCCIEREEKILIYEYMHNKSLDYFIFDESRSALLDWPTRFDIIMGIARGLLYLHHDSRLKIIHRDLKTSNILLDENLNAKISDFGLARLFEGDQNMASTRRVVGTYGYMAPEYAFDGKFCVKSDVFSMGVVILEIVSGRKNRGFEHSSTYQNLLEQAWLFWKERRELEVMDSCYSSSYVEWQVRRCIHVGLLCVQKSADERPMMPSVLLMLSTEDTLLPEPKKPGFFLDSSFNNTSHMYASGNSITNSDFEGR